MASITLSALRDSTRQRSDMVNSQFVTDVELNGYINASLAELYDLLVSSFEDYYSSQTTLTTDGITDSVPLPADFYKMRGVDAAQNPANNQWLTLRRFNFNERNVLNRGVTPTSLGLPSLRYLVFGNTLKLTPLPPANITLRAYYIPTISYLVNDTDAFNFISGFEEYVIIDASIKCMQKEESDVSILALQKQAIIKRIQDMAPNRDAGEAAHITDVSQDSQGGNRGWY